MRLQNSKRSQESWQDAQIEFTKDLTDAIALTNSLDIEKEARLLRYKKGEGKYYPATEQEFDFEWLKSSFEGLERARFIFEDLTRGDFIFNFPEKALPLLNEVVELGYREPEVYVELAEVHYLTFNYGLALEVINEAANKVNDANKLYAKVLTYKGGILVKMGKFQEARTCYHQASAVRRARKWPVTQDFYSVTPGTRSILLAYALAQEFGESIGWAEQIAVKSLVFDFGRQLSKARRGGKGAVNVRTRLDEFEEEYPGVLDILRKIVGEEDWQTLREDAPLMLKARFPSISDQLPKVQY